MVYYLLMVVLFVSAFMINGVLFGFKGVGAGNGLLGAPATQRFWLNSLGGVMGLYTLRYIEVLLYGTMAFMISAVSRSNALTVGTSLMIMLFGPEFANFVSDTFWARFLLFPNLDLARYVMGNPALVPGMSLGFSIVALLIYWALFYSLAWVAFVKRDVLN